MSVEVVDGQTVIDFLNDSESFSKYVNEKFQTLDFDGDGVLSRDELQTRLGKSSSGELELQSKEEIGNIYDVLFDRFDVDRSGTIDRNEFCAMAKELMMAKARGIGDLPVSIILQGDSLLMRAVERRRNVGEGNSRDGGRIGADGNSGGRVAGGEEVGGYGKRKKFGWFGIQRCYGCASGTNSDNKL